MKKRIARIPALITLGFLSSTEALWAHQGHGFDGTVQNLLHWLSSPDHVVAVLVLVGLSGVLAYAWASRRFSRRSF